MLADFPGTKTRPGPAQRSANLVLLLREASKALHSCEHEDLAVTEYVSEAIAGNSTAPIRLF